VSSSNRRCGGVAAKMTMKNVVETTTLQCGGGKGIPSLKKKKNKMKNCKPGLVEIDLGA
jgi:hypothetical protein